MDAIRDFEGVSLKSYKCPAGVWTIGVGHTRGVREGQTITSAQVDSLLKGDLLPCESYVNSLRLSLTQGQFDALVDFCFNLGETNLGDSTLLKKVICKASEEEIKKEFSRWVYAGKVKLIGLVRRRNWEAQRYCEKR